MIELNENDLQKVTGGQIVAADGTYSNGGPGERYCYTGTCRICRRKWLSTESHGSCPCCGGSIIWATRR